MLLPPYPAGLKSECLLKVIRMHYERKKQLRLYRKYNSEFYFSGSNNRKMREKEMLNFSLRESFSFLKGRFWVQKLCKVIYKAPKFSPVF